MGGRKHNTIERRLCLASIQNLDYPKDRYEVIIVDGHSTDDTVEIAEKYGCKVVYEDVGTRGDGCNIGVKNAKGEYIAFTDADCVAQKDWLKNLIKQFTMKKIASAGDPNITLGMTRNLQNALVRFYLLFVVQGLTGRSIVLYLYYLFFSKSSKDRG